MELLERERQPKREERGEVRENIVNLAFLNSQIQTQSFLPWMVLFLYPFFTLNGRVNCFFSLINQNFVSC